MIDDLNAMNNDNPLLDFTGPPRFDLIRPEHVRPGIDALLRAARVAIERVGRDTRPATWASVVAPTETSD
ncbi:MAG TPA: hypothetical protein VIF33_06520, partial [Casimicrobiaceae bacterium]